MAELQGTVKISLGENVNISPREPYTLCITCKKRPHAQNNWGANPPQNGEC